MLTIGHYVLDDRIFYKEAQTLLNAGYQVSLVCAIDANGSAWDMGRTKRINTSGELQWHQNGVAVYAIPLPVGWKRWANKIFQGPFAKQFVTQAVQLSADVYHSHEPASYYLGRRITRRTATKLIFDNHESWSTNSWKDKIIVKWFLNKLEFAITANENTKKSLLQRYPTIKAITIYNAAQKEVFPDLAIRYPLDSPTIVHEGYLPFNRGLKVMLNTLLQLKKDKPSIRLKLIGSMPDEEQMYFEQFVLHHNLSENIDYVGWVDYADIATPLRNAHIGLIFKDLSIPNNKQGGPCIKLFNYLAAGLTVLSVDIPSNSKLIQQWQIGETIATDNTTALAKTILNYLDNGEILEKNKSRARSLFKERWNWDEEGRKLLEYYKEVVLD